MNIISTAFMQHVADHGLSYGTVEEFSFRQNLFNTLDDELNQINFDAARAGLSHRVGHNFMSTWTQGERKRLLGYRDVGVVSGDVAELPAANAAQVDWRDNNAVTPVKDQAQCGSCWSFSTTGSLEGAHAIATGELLSFSEEQLVQCATTFNHGCNGGSMQIALMYFKTHHPALESVYPYTSGTGIQGTCNTSVATVSSVSVASVKSVPANSWATGLKSAIALGPVSVAIEADKTVFQQYKSGVLSGNACGTTLDHGVLAVGYGTEDGVDFVLIKNSWGSSWGDAGYIKLAAIEGAGTCGVNMQPVYPTVV